jgi:hypothetical protein
MANLARLARRSIQTQPWPSLSVDQLPAWMGQLGYQGLGYQGGIVQTLSHQKTEEIQGDFEGLIAGAMRSNGAVFACILTRMLLFSEARFQFRRLNNGRPGKLFGTSDLQILENPWPGATTGDLLSRASVDVDIAGNFFCTRQPLFSGGAPRQPGNPTQRIMRLRPDWMTIIKGTVESASDPKFARSLDPTAELVGYLYHPGGRGSGIAPVGLLPEEVMHWAPIPDPGFTFKGMSWLEPVLNEVLGDKAMTVHKMMYFEQGATPNLVVSMDTGKMNRETFKDWIDAFEQEHEGAFNAYKTLYLGNGASATVVGSSLKDLDYAIVQGHGETRIAAAAGIPPIIVGFSEGLEAATYSNFAQARRAFADKTLRPMWRNFAGSLETIVEPPAGSMMWYDDRDIPFLMADIQDNAAVQSTKSAAIRQLVDAGFDPESVVDAIEQNDFTLLTHSGLYSVQLQPAGSTTPGAVNMQPGALPGPLLPGQTPPGGNGNGNNENGSLPNGSGTSNNGSKQSQAKSAPESGILRGHRHRSQQLAEALQIARAGQN